LSKKILYNRFDRWFPVQIQYKGPTYGQEYAKSKWTSPIIMKKLSRQVNIMNQVYIQKN